MLHKMDNLVQNLVTEQTSNCGTSERSLISLHSKESKHMSQFKDDDSDSRENVLLDDSTLNHNQGVFMTNLNDGAQDKDKD